METTKERVDREAAEQALVGLWHKARRKGLVPESEYEQQLIDEAQDEARWYIDNLQEREGIE